MMNNKFCRKYEEIYPPEVTEFVYITDDTYTKKQVLRMEQLVLGVLEFNVTVPTSFFFANHFSKVSINMIIYMKNSLQRFFDAINADET